MEAKALIWNRGGEVDWTTWTYLSLTVRPKVDAYADEKIDGRIGRLVEQDGHESAQRIHDQPGLDAAVYRSAGEELERPFPEQADDAEEEVEDLQDGRGFDGAVEVLGQEVPEDLGPEEAFERGGNLVGGGGEDDEPGPVIFD